jgi:purine nucleosidase
MTKQAIILDTDIGTDVDDLLALITLIMSTKIKNISVVTTNGPTAVRAKIALSALELLDVKNIPVFIGKSHSRTHTTPFVHGRETDQALSNNDPLPLRNLPIWCDQNDPNSITIISIGPLTTVSWLISHNQVKDKIKRIVWMGGSIPENNVPRVEHNLQADQVAVKTVLKSKIPIFIIPLNISIKHPFKQAEIKQFKLAQSDLGKFTWLGMSNWLQTTKHFIGGDKIFKNKVFLHDPITVVGALKLSRLTWIKTTININKNGSISIPGNNEVNICTNLPSDLITALKAKLFSIINKQE